MLKKNSVKTIALLCNITLTSNPEAKIRNFMGWENTMTRLARYRGVACYGDNIIDQYYITIGVQ